MWIAPGYEVLDKTVIGSEKRAVGQKLPEREIKRLSGALHVIGSVKKEAVGQKLPENEIKHLNGALHVMSSVNQLITRECSRAPLLEGICQIFNTTRGYSNTWIVLLGDTLELVTTREAFLNGNLLPIIEMLKERRLTNCCQRALRQSDVVATENPVSNCVDCPLPLIYSEHAVLTVRMEYRGKVYGILCASVPPDLALDRMEHTLLKVVAKDIAFAMNKLELEKEHNRAKVTLKESEERCRVLVEHMADGVALVQKGRCLFVNNAFTSMLGYEDSMVFVGKDYTDHILSDYREPLATLYKNLEDGESVDSVFLCKCVSKDGREFWVEKHLNRIKWNGEPAVLATTIDVNERRLREIAVENEAEELRKENANLRLSMNERFRFGNIIGKSPAIQEVYELILKAAGSDANVVIYGESGTGKELVAKAIHDNCKGHDKEFVTVNCGAIPETLLESEFFGYKKGAFTGAAINKLGFLDIANGGTLFLDEIGELLLNMQAKLLRAIGNGGYSPLGSTHVKRSEFRIIAATNRNLQDAVKKGKMREDFYYRIEVIRINLPPLRDRKEDIPFLVEHFLKSSKKNQKIGDIPKNIMDAIYNYDWPGNVRELQNILQRYLAVGKLDLSSSDPGNVEISNLEKEADQEIFNLRSAVNNFERNHILKTLKATRWQKNRAALKLGISRNTFFRKIKELDLN